MTTINPLLSADNPELAEEIANLIGHFDRTFDFSSAEDQSTFVEGMAMLGRHIALRSATAKLEVSHGSKGVFNVTASSVPK